MSRLSFRIEASASGSRARAGRFRTLHGEVLTPLFMPVGTQATVKAQTREGLLASGSQVLLANTYHLFLRPGLEVFERFGGIHDFMGWKGSVLTDSGGFQIFSLPHSRKMSEEGAVFQSYIDGRKILFTPEISIQAQRAIGSDIMMVLDQCISSTADEKAVRDAMDLTHRWAKRSLAARGESPQALFAIVQGACVPELRGESARILSELPFDGFAIGGLAVGESKNEREDITEQAAALLPIDLPRYLMGVGTPIDLLEAVHRGVDMFDCTIPTAFAQRGTVFTSQGKVQLRRSSYRLSDAPVDADCGCATCRGYSRGYLHHLIKSDEVLGWQLLGAHNIHFYHALMKEMRGHILSGDFSGYYRQAREKLVQGDGPEKNPSIRGAFGIHLSPGGFAAVKELSSGEVMHSVNDPAEEARRLYVEQPELARRLGEAQGELVVWDVGLGAASNAMAVVRCFESGEALRPLRIVSFENDLDALRLAFENVDRFPHLKHPAPGKILKRGKWNSRNFRWELLEGDFLEKMGEAPRPDLILYDPFSHRSAPVLWTHGVFSRIFDLCSDGPTELYTYSASTAVRAALLCAGFLVARGVGSGPKEETTVALTEPAFRSRFRSFELLAGDWLERWERSAARYPLGMKTSERQKTENAIRMHRQFCGRLS